MSVFSSVPPRSAAALVALLSAACAAAQGPAAPIAPAATASAPPAQRIDVTGARQSESEQRREATASKLIVGRDEIERFGDATTGELLKRLPGVTLQGAPGRGGAVRLRGLGSGYTQILVDGERMPAGFSLDSIVPTQIERIEILRAPTAETGAQAIAGTINVVTRDGFRKRLAELRLAMQLEAGRWSPSASWNRNGGLGGGESNYHFSLNAWQRRDRAESRTRTTDAGPPTLDQFTDSHSLDDRSGLNANGRLQWRGAEGESLSVTPVLLHSQTETGARGIFRLATGAPKDALYDHFDLTASNRFTLGRLGMQGTLRSAEGTRFEARANLSASTFRVRALRSERDADDALLRTVDERTDREDTGASAALKASRLIGEGHNAVAGVEAETERRDDVNTSLQNGAALLTDFGENVRAASSRFALYAQDEWALGPQVSAYAGLRWERIATEGSGEEGRTIRRHSDVWSPLVHALWRPDPKRRDQLRFSLTRSYRAPGFANLLARPALNSRYPVPGANTPTNADRAGNPALVPELATGIDIAFERYLAGGGVLSAGVFRRRIGNVIRSLTTLEPVSWASVPRYVLRPQNIGKATTEGVELDAKLRLSEVWPGAPPIDLRANAGIFRSRVESVPGPDNRLDQQPGASGNLGADYRLRRWPLTLGGNLNWTPGYDTRLAAAQSAYTGPKRVVDAYALWSFDAARQLRLSMSNLAAADYVTAAALDGETAETRAASYINWQLRLEIKL